MGQLNFVLYLLKSSLGFLVVPKEFQVWDITLYVSCILNEVQNKS